MRIGVNLIPLRPGQMGGAEVYLRDLLAGLLERGGHEYVLVTADYNHDTLPEDSERCRRVLFAREGGAGGDRRWIVRLFSRLGRARPWLRDGYRRYVPAPLRGLLRPVIHRVARAIEMGLGWLRGQRRQGRAESLRELVRREGLDLWF